MIVGSFLSALFHLGEEQSNRMPVWGGPVTCCTTIKYATLQVLSRDDFVPTGTGLPAIAPPGAELSARDDSAREIMSRQGTNLKMGSYRLHW